MKADLLIIENFSPTGLTKGHDKRNSENDPRVAGTLRNRQRTCIATVPRHQGSKKPCDTGRQQRPEGSGGGREHVRARLHELRQVRAAGLGTRRPPEARPQSHGGGWGFTPERLGPVAHMEAGPLGCRVRSEGSWRWTFPWGRSRGDRERQDRKGTAEEPTDVPDGLERGVREKGSGRTSVFSSLKVYSQRTRSTLVRHPEDMDNCHVLSHSENLDN